MDNVVFVENCPDYSSHEVARCLDCFDVLFRDTISPGDIVVLKPNWIAQHHRYNKTEWKSVITHPAIITEVLRKVVDYLQASGKIIITDGPQTDSSFQSILQRMPVTLWKEICSKEKIDLSIIDLRDHEWLEKGDVVLKRVKLPGDPLGSILYDLQDSSELEDHIRSIKGYYGADYCTEETNEAHSLGKHLYKLSRTVIEADVFVNLPKLKTHKKAGITCSLKNLVGINTYKNFLPHYSEGTPSMGGDQFPANKFKSGLEVNLLRLFKKNALRMEGRGAKFLILLKKIGRLFFGKTTETIRGGNWYGNDTLWRMVIDLNKLLFYGDAEGRICVNGHKKKKKYITIVDAVIAGQGNGPEAPDLIEMGLILAGSNPVAVDCVAAKIMGFDYEKIPVLSKSFQVKKLPLVSFAYDKIKLQSSSWAEARGELYKIPFGQKTKCQPASGWIGHIEIN